MLFVFMLMDKAESSGLRQRIRPEHKACLTRMQDRIPFAGPLVAAKSGLSRLKR